jgi:hypothetical protein
MISKQYFGFEFIKVAVAAITDIKADFKYDKKVLRNWDVVLEFLYPDCEKASQSAYLVFADDFLKYAGEYSESFQKRFLRKRNGLWYLWHSANDFRVQEILKSDNPPEISIWLCIDPTLVAPDGECWNISVAIEQRIIVEHQPEWNRRGKNKRANGLLPRKIIDRKSVS